jgi:hypothetical protein
VRHFQTACRKGIQYSRLVQWVKEYEHPSVTRRLENPHSQVSLTIKFGVALWNVSECFLCESAYLMAFVFFCCGHKPVVTKLIEVEVEVTLRLTFSQSVCLAVEPTLGLATRYYFLSERCCLKVAVFFLWGTLSDERTGLQFAVQSLNGLSSTEPVTILYCLI